MPHLRCARWWACLLAAGVLVACGKAAFTEGVRSQYGLTADDIRRIQLYTSDDLVLQRQLDSQEKSVEGNELRVRGGIRIEQVVIPAGTPGVAVRVEGDYLLVSFNREHPDHALWFSAKKGGAASIDRTYELTPLENGLDDPPPFQPRVAKGFLISYAGHKYHVLSDGAWHVHLMFDGQSFGSEKVKEQPPGWKLSDGPASPAAPGGSASAPDGGPR